jgi:hypothetical protein
MTRNERVAHDVKTSEAQQQVSRWNAAFNAATHRVDSATDRLDDVLAEEDAGERREAAARAVLARAEQDRDEAQSKRQAAYAELNRLDDIFHAEGRWNRYFLCTNTNGHLHITTACSSCFPTTTFVWVVELSDRPHADVVAEYGDDVCTVCVSYAPVGRRKSEEEAQAAKDERAAKKAERDRVKAEKAITQRDGRPLREESHKGYDGVGQGYEIKTLATAKREATDAFENAFWSAAIFFEARHAFDQDTRTHNARLAARHLAQAVYLADAIAAKTGRTPSEVVAEHLAKASKKVKKAEGGQLPEAPRRFVAEHLVTISEYLEAVAKRA